MDAIIKRSLVLPADGRTLIAELYEDGTAKVAIHTRSKQVGFILSPKDKERLLLVLGADKPKTAHVG